MDMGRDWISLYELIIKRPDIDYVVLATAIEQSALLYIDEFSRRKLASDESAEVCGSKKFALNVLYEYIRMKRLQERLPDDHPLIGDESALYSYGWLLDALPDFSRINPHYVTKNKQTEISKTSQIKNNRNLLDPAIDEAINQAGNMETADVYLKLKELAISGYNPFTGEIEGDALCYTNDNNSPDKLTKNALGKRLKGRKINAI